MVISSSGHKFVPTRSQFVCEHLSILECLLRVRFELWRLRFFECNGDSRDSVHMRSSLHTREYCPIDSRRNIFYRIFRFLERIGNDSFAENQRSSRSSERLVRRRHHHMESVVQWIFQESCSNKSSDMRHISECDCSHFFCDCYEFFVFELSRICRKSCEKYFGFML